MRGNSVLLFEYIAWESKECLIGIAADVFIQQSKFFELATQNGTVLQQVCLSLCLIIH
jgi:hypothetical protein